MFFKIKFPIERELSTIHFCTYKNYSITRSDWLKTYKFKIKNRLKLAAISVDFDHRPAKERDEFTDSHTFLFIRRTNIFKKASS